LRFGVFALLLDLFDSIFFEISSCFFLFLFRIQFAEPFFSLSLGRHNDEDFSFLLKQKDQVAFTTNLENVVGKLYSEANPDFVMAFTDRLHLLFVNPVNQALGEFARLFLFFFFFFFFLRMLACLLFRSVWFVL
jgi:hypothetical protein